MTEHKCSESEKVNFKITHKGSSWKFEQYGLGFSGAKFCPFCGEELPKQYEDGFYWVRLHYNIPYGCVYEKNMTVARILNGLWYGTNGNNFDIDNHTVIRRIEME